MCQKETGFVRVMVGLSFVDGKLASRPAVDTSSTVGIDR